MSCHSNQSEYALAFQPEQLNRAGPDGRNQLAAFTEAGIIQRTGQDGKPLPPPLGPTPNGVVCFQADGRMYSVICEAVLFIPHG